MEGEKRTTSPGKSLWFPTFAFNNVLHKSKAKSSACVAFKNKEFLNRTFPCLCKTLKAKDLMTGR